MKGLILNAHGDDVVELDWPGQPPAFYIGKTPVFEVWFEDRESGLWFVMTATPDVPRLRGGIGFHPMLPKADLIKARDAWREHVRSAQPS